MICLRSSLPSLLAGLLLLSARPAAAAPSAPSGPHPRIALDAPTLRALKTQVKTAGSAAHEAIVACEKAETGRGGGSGYQGDAWAFGASSCALAYLLTGEPAHATRGVALLRALLEDVRQIGDGKACVAGAPLERAVASIRRDTGYAIRFIGPHAALAYDWLHDAPGMTEALRRQSRDCIHTWIDWYTRKGYLNTQPGANYHAGFVLAKALAAIATAGESSTGAEDPGARQWREVVDEVFAAQLVGNGLARNAGGLPRGPHHGVLIGGDWAEGWQYGPLSVIEYALAARALEEQGAAFPEMHAWLDDVMLRYLYALTPAGDQSYVGGDVENEGPTIGASPGPLTAVLLGPSSARAAGWAAALRRRPNLARYGVPVFDALAEARAATPVDPRAGTALPRGFLALGTRTLYARSDWGRAAFWMVFTSSPRQVDDHQHMDASNFVLSRGDDALIVDPSPYGSRSSLTGNALTVDSDVVGPSYRPSQTPWSDAELPWARTTASGVVAARADVSRAFAFASQPSDISLARRDWVFLPEGEVVTIDRARTAGRDHLLRLRFRTPASLTLAGGIARGRVGGSSLAIHAVRIDPAAAPRVAAIAAGGNCDDELFGACKLARFPVGEYAVEVPGPDALAIHVIDGLPADAAPARVRGIGDPDIAGAPDGNQAVAGVEVTRDGHTSFVVTAARARGPKDQSALTYLVPGGGASRQVVFDAPEDREGRSSVAASPTGDGRCRLVIRAGGAPAMAGRPLIFTMAPAAGGCAIAGEADAPLSGSNLFARQDWPAARPVPSSWEKIRPLLRRVRHLPHKKAIALAGLLGAGIGLWLLRRVVVAAGRRRRRVQGT